MASKKSTTGNTEAVKLRDSPQTANVPSSTLSFPSLRRVSIAMESSKLVINTDLSSPKVTTSTMVRCLLFLKRRDSLPRLKYWTEKSRESEFDLFLSFSCIHVGQQRSSDVSTAPPQKTNDGIQSDGGTGKLAAEILPLPSSVIREDEDKLITVQSSPKTNVRRASPKRKGSVSEGQDPNKVKKKRRKIRTETTEIDDIFGGL